MSTRDALILDDVFEVIQKDPDGKKFDRGGLRGVLARERKHTWRTCTCLYVNMKVILEARNA